MKNDPRVLAAAILAGAVLLHGYWTAAEVPRYQVAAAGKDGNGAWRIDTRTGKVSMCGTPITGAGFGFLQQKQADALKESAPKLDLDQFIQNATTIEARARIFCTGWTGEPNK